MLETGRIGLGIEWLDFKPDRALSELTESLVRQKYSQAEFITKR